VVTNGGVTTYKPIPLPYIQKWAEGERGNNVQGSALSFEKVTLKSIHMWAIDYRVLFLADARIFLLTTTVSGQWMLRPERKADQFCLRSVKFGPFQVLERKGTFKFCTKQIQGLDARRIDAPRYGGNCEAWKLGFTHS
jgi:hypothetical protein